MARATYTVPELAELFNLSINSIYSALRKKQIPSLKIGGKYVIPKAAIDNLLLSASTGTNPENQPS